MGADVLASRAGFEAQWAALRAWVDTVPADAWGRPCVLEGWTVTDLVLHLTRGIELLARIEPAEPGAVPLSIAQYVGAYPGAAAAIAEGTRALAADLGDDVTGALDASWSRTVEGLDGWGSDGRRVVSALRGPIRLDDMVLTRTLELVVHGDDLARSVPEVEPPVHDRGALRDVVKLLLGVLAERAPGHTVEVRVPPFAAVQCIEGASHTRGTPPNTVETDPLTWVRVACGRVPWSEAVHDGTVRASGTRAPDLAPHLPLL